MSPREKFAETDVARPVVAWLRDQHWDVHQEVAPGGGGSRRADVVAAQGRVLYVVEVKVTLSLELIEQAMGWLQSAHYVSVAVPYNVLHRSGRGVLQFVCQHHGIGLLGVRGIGDDRSWGGPFIDIHRSPRLRRRVTDGYLRKALCEETRTLAEAGSNLNRYHTPFRQTCNTIAQVIGGSATPLTTRELVAAITHHYSSDASARSCLPSWLRAGKVPGVVPVPGQPERWAWDADAARRAS